MTRDSNAEAFITVIRRLLVVNFLDECLTLRCLYSLLCNSLFSLSRVTALLFVLRVRCASRLLLLLSNSSYSSPLCVTNNRTAAQHHSISSHVVQSARDAHDAMRSRVHDAIARDVDSLCSPPDAIMFWERNTTTLPSLKAYEYIHRRILLHRDQSQPHYIVFPCHRFSTWNFKLIYTRIFCNLSYWW